MLQRIVKAEYYPIEVKMETIEWACRYVDFMSNDEVQKFFLVFRELYANSDAGIRNGYIQANHSNDSILVIVEFLSREFNKYDYASQ